MTIWTVWTYSQIRPLQNYVVIIFEQTVKNKKAEVREYYWIIPIDTLDQIKELPAKIPLYPLYFNDSTENCYRRCVEGKEVFYLENNGPECESNNMFIRNFLKLIKDHRIQLETIEIGWKNRSEKKLYLEETNEKGRKISVFCTPVSGVFANCPQCADKSLHGEYFSKVFLPVSDMSYFPDFWETNHFNLLSRTNFMFLDYTSGVMYDYVNGISKPVIGK